MPLNQDRFVSTLARLVGQGEQLQNSLDAGLRPSEEVAAKVVLERLNEPIRSGAIQVKRVAAKDHPDRPNLILTIEGRNSDTLSFVGAHFDVVPADRNAEGWTTDPFQLFVDEDGLLHGRGVTDCLGHVALLTELLVDLVEQGIRPNRTLHVVMISNEEESSVPGIGLDYLDEQGHLEALTRGPMIWLDSADFGPTLGTGGIAAWELIAEGVPGHSGMPQNCVNALELLMVASLELSRWFKLAYPPHPKESEWKYASPSSMKTTIIDVENRKVTKIPGLARAMGDIRMTPFYDIDEAVNAACAEVDRLNERLSSPTHGDILAAYRTSGGIAGKLSFIPKPQRTSGIACDLKSPALGILSDAIRATRGIEAYKPWAMTGSLPLVRDLQRRGVDIQITGFGCSAGYHAPNEFGRLRDFVDGYEILMRLIEQL